MSLMFTVEDEPDRTIPEDTICRSRLEELKKETIEYADKQTGEKKSFDKLIWWWKVVEGTHKDRKIRGECPAELTNHPNNRFRNWAEALLGRELPAGVALTVDDLLGLQADVSVSHRTYKDRIYEQVDEVLPIEGIGTDGDVPF